MANTDPQQNLLLMAVAAVLLGFASATQDIVIDAYRIEVAVARLQALLSSTYVAGYRVAMVASGAGVLYLAQAFGSSAELYSYTAWRYAYSCMALLLLLGIGTTLLVKEPVPREQQTGQYSTGDHLRFFLLFLVSISVLVGTLVSLPSAPQWFVGYAQPLFTFVWGALCLVLALVLAFAVARFSLLFGWVNSTLVYQGYQAPIMEFFKRYGRLAVWVLLLVGFYRVSDIVLGVIANVFYQDMGYNKAQIASVTKIFGVGVTIAGSFFGGLLVLRLGIMRILLLGAVLVVITNLLFIWLAQVDADIRYLAVVIAADNLSQGIAIAAFIAWLSSLTNVSFTATQYAIFSSLMTLFPKLLGGYSGTLVDAFGYTYFFLFASALGLPLIALIYFLRARLR